MFARLFAETGLSLDRLRALVEVGATGSIAQAAAGDPIRQSQYSRQIKELEDFFQTKLVERHGKGIRLTTGGRELARISRFFLMGLSNFRRGCRAEEQTFRLGASATFLQQLLVPTLAGPAHASGPRHAVETVPDRDIERRLHELTLDFGIVTADALSRPLELRTLGSWRLRLWVPKALAGTGALAVRALKDRRLAFTLAVAEIPEPALARLQGREPRLSCGSFLEARAALNSGGSAAFLPDFLEPEPPVDRFVCLVAPTRKLPVLHYRLAWNPRLLRLNPHATRQRDRLLATLSATLTAASHRPGVASSRMREQHRDPLDSALAQKD